MAYLDLDDIFARTVAKVQLPLVEPAHPADFTLLEQTVITLARGTGVASLSEPGPIVRSVRRLFGLDAPRPLANPKLEALRRFAVHAWHRGYALPAPVFEAFLKAGFDIDQAETLLAHITNSRPRRQGRTS